MNPGFVVRFRPLGPWRPGNGGARDRVDDMFHSDSLFSAVTQAMMRLGELDAWLAATVQAPSAAVRLSSLFPYLDETLFVPPPKSLWPPQPSAKVRWANARFIPLAAVRDLVADRPLNDSRWDLDAASGCLLPAEAKLRSGPFRVSLRSHAAVDRVTESAVEVHRTACLEFCEGGGFWGVVSFTDEEARGRWAGPVQAAVRLLADTGIGGERSIGWGRSAEPVFTDGTLPGLLVPQSVSPETPPASPDTEASPEPRPPVSPSVYWMLSLYSPGAGDSVDWQRGCYSLVTRGGRVESPERSGDRKKLLRMVEEGSVVAASEAPNGAAPDVSPEGFPHPVYRSGFALAVPLPQRQPERTLGAS